MAFREWVGSVWFQGLFRGSLIVASIAVPSIMGLWWFAWDRAQTDAVREVVAVKAALANATETLDTRATDAETFQGEVREALEAVDGRLGKVDDRVYDVAVDVETIKRLLQTQIDTAALTDWPRRPATQ